MDGPFDSDGMDDAAGDSADLAIDAAFDESDAGDHFTDESASADHAASADDFQAESGDEFGDGFSEGADDMALWNAFEEEVADGLDAGDADEFLGRLLGGLGRAAGVVGRGMGRAAGAAGRVGSMAQGVGRAAGQVGAVAGAVAPAAQAAARLARLLGAPGVAGALGQVGNLARGVRGAAGRVGGIAGSVGQTAQGAQGLFGQLSQLLGQGLDEIDAFDAMADLYVEDGIDEALPAAVGLAARAAARGLGFGTVAQMSQAGRRALVRGVAAAARELVRGRGPQGVRALPRLAQASSRVARRRSQTPGSAAQAVRRGMPAAARRVVQNPRLMRQMARSAARPTSAPLARPSDIGRGVRTGRPGGVRTYHLSGPVTLSITAR